MEIIVHSLGLCLNMSVFFLMKDTHLHISRHTIPVNYSAESSVICLIF